MLGVETVVVVVRKVGTDVPRSAKILEYLSFKISFATCGGLFGGIITFGCKFRRLNWGLVGVKTGDAERARDDGVLGAGVFTKRAARLAVSMTIDSPEVLELFNVDWSISIGSAPPPKSFNSGTDKTRLFTSEDLPGVRFGS